TTLFFFLTGGLMALVIRLQLETSSGTVVSAERYDQIFTMHGTTMIFLFVVPVMAAFGNYIVPLQIGARDMAFPRLNAASFWLLLFGGIAMYSSFLFGGGPDAGWTGYPPLSVLSPGHGIDFWIVGLHVLTLSSLLGAINFICTIHNMRAPGMRFTRMPLFTWTIEFYSIMIIAALPVLSGALTMVLLDRNFGTNFYDPSNNGNIILYQPLFSFFGHPEVYVIALPRFGLFMIGGLSGIFLAAYPVDLQVTDTYFVVAHFHYVMGSVPVFAVIGGLHYWYPKLTGRMLNRAVAVWSFWVLFVGFNLTFFPM